MMSKSGVRVIKTIFSSSYGRGAAKFLAENGFVVLRPPGHILLMSNYRDRFINAVLAFPEFRRDVPVLNKTRHYTRGGFGALGCASSFHNPFARELRVEMHTVVYHLFRELIAADSLSPNKYFAQVIDRMMIREAGVAAFAEDWHRDIHAQGLESDQFYGGWLNLGEKDDVFICRAGTHQPDNLDEHSIGFSKVRDEDLLDALNESHEQVIVPPGHIIVIDETILHKVNGKKAEATKFRLFTAWRLTMNSGSEFPRGLSKMLEDQAVVTIKSGQVPVMYPATDVTYRIGDLVNWAATELQPCMLEARKRSDKAVVFPGQTLMLPKRQAPSLKETGLQMYAPYPDWERKLYIASKTHEIPYNNNEMRTLRFAD
jgi:hypothetical protein